MNSGVLPNPYDTRDFSFERTFGTATPLELPDEYNADLGIDWPDQNKDGRPNGCTGYTQNELGQDEYGLPFDPGFVYDNTLQIAGLAPNSPVMVRDSFKATKIYGLKRRKVRKGETVPDPVQFRRGAYFDVDKVGDYFDGVRSALWLNRLHNRTVSAGAPWFWRKAQGDGTLADFDAKKLPDVWHNFKISGWKTIKGKPYLIVKPWCGRGWGDNGYGYMSRELFNKLFSISGTFLYTQANAKPEDIKTIKIDILEFVLSLYQRLIKTLGSWNTHGLSSQG